MADLCPRRASPRFTTRLRDDVHAVAPSAGPRGRRRRGRGAPLVCGALGSLSTAARVLAMASALGGGLWPAHEDERSILLLDREPIRWEGDRERGRGWIEGDRVVRSGGDLAARRALGACGLVAAGSRRFIHSSVSGLAPVYWIEDERRDVLRLPDRPARRGIAPAALGRLGRLGGDHRAPLSARRTDAVRRDQPPRLVLGPPPAPGPHPRRAADLAVDGGRPPSEHRRGGGGGHHALRGSLAPLEVAVLCPLSGGRDSRILLCAFPERERVSTYRAHGQRRRGWVARGGSRRPGRGALGVAHERIAAAAADYPRDWAERARRVEYQFVDHAWLDAARPPDRRQPRADARRVRPSTSILASRTSASTASAAARHEQPSRRQPGAVRGLRRYGHAEQALAERLRGRCSPAPATSSWRRPSRSRVIPRR